MSPRALPRECPCHSELRYGLCCKPFHDGVVPAPHPEALMRSRYAAFAMGLGAYLVDTLAATHPERFRPREVLVRELSAVHLTQRFVGLRIVDGGVNSDDPVRGQVLFHAGIFVRGRDQSFVELSDFVHEPGGWRYADGVLTLAKIFNAQELSSLTRAMFLARVEASET